MVSSWVSHIVKTGKDASGLSRWSYTEIQGCDNKQFILLSGYQVCKNQNINMGSNNTFNQQYQLLHQQGYQTPDPCTQFLDNIISQIKTWREQHNAVLICIDANENPKRTSTRGIAQILMKLIYSIYTQFATQTKPSPQCTAKVPHQ